MPLPKVVSKSEPKLLHRLQCGECGWNLSVLAATDAPLCVCPWCGWEDLTISKLSRQGLGAEIECEVHGKVTVQVLNENVLLQDMSPDPLWCPFCSAEDGATQGC
jgi:predicted nucleic acid-binding Zn ribbon protein